MYRDEGPSPEDIERFNRDETGFCPECGAELWDNADNCPKCGAWITGDVSHRHPETEAMRKRMITLIVILVLIGFLGLFGFLNKIF
jgi:uncharacterized membrane protein YvbJ